MRASVIQLKQVVFQRVLVDAVVPPDGSAPVEAAGFDFNGVQFRVALDAQPATGEGGDESQAFVVALEMSIEVGEEKPAPPYEIDVSALGIVEVSDVIEEAKCRDLALVNGGSLVYGAIRELVTTITGRCIAGPLVLPTADFRDHSELRIESPVDRSDSEPES